MVVDMITFAKNMFTHFAPQGGQGNKNINLCESVSHVYRALSTNLQSIIIIVVFISEGYKVLKNDFSHLFLGNYIHTHTHINISDVCCF